MKVFFLITGLIWVFIGVSSIYNIHWAATVTGAIMLIIALIKEFHDKR